MNPLLLQIAARTWTRIAMVTVTLAIAGTGIEVATGASGENLLLQVAGWWGLLFFVGAAIALVDLWAQLADNGELTGAISIGISARHMFFAMALPAILAAAGAGVWQAAESDQAWTEMGGVPALKTAPDVSLERHLEHCERSEDTSCQWIAELDWNPSLKDLRGVGWSGLQRFESGNLERTRRVGEPLLALILAPLSILLLKRWRRRRAGGLRAAGLLVTLGAGTLLYAIWSLVLIVADGTGTP